jgi:magnesium chelatase family protein
MSLAVVRSRAPAAGRAPEVTVEVHLANGLPSFSIVGLPDLEVRESRERVRAALQNCDFDFPVRRITVNLAPADLPKESGRFDLPIALGILAASGQIPAESLLYREFAGELSLTGALRPMRGAFAMACGTARGALKSAPDTDATSETPSAFPAPQVFTTPQLYLPAASAPEAALVPGVDVFGAADLPSLCAHLAGSPDARLSPVAAPELGEHATAAAPDMADVIGQRAARRALEVAAAGGHHVLLIGPPGAGKSMLAARLPGLLPPMTDDEALASAALLSASRIGFRPSQWRRRPFRAPHHSSSAAALVGGRNPPQPGEITLAHLGVLFLDELEVRCFGFVCMAQYFHGDFRGGAGGGPPSTSRRRLLDDRYLSVHGIWQTLFLHRHPTLQSSQRCSNATGDQFRVGSQDLIDNSGFQFIRTSAVPPKFRESEKYQFFQVMTTKKQKPLRNRDV